MNSKLSAAEGALLHGSLQNSGLAGLFTGGESHLGSLVSKEAVCPETGIPDSQLQRCWQFASPRLLTICLLV